MHHTITTQASRLLITALLSLTAMATTAQTSADATDTESTDGGFLKGIGNLIGFADKEQSAEEQLAAYVEKSLEGRFKVVSVRMDVKPGLNEVILEDGSALYAFQNSEYFILGDLWHLTPDSRPINITDSESRGPLRAELVGTIMDEDLIIFPAEGVRKASITVFTDVDCGYCRRLHQEVPELNASGVEVRYAAFPRSGPSSVAADKMSNAWCATDRRNAMTRLKQGASISPANCAGAANIGKQYEIGQRLGITGTPSIISSQGKMQPGYLTADELLKWLDI